LVAVLAQTRIANGANPLTGFFAPTATGGDGMPPPPGGPRTAPYSGSTPGAVGPTPDATGSGISGIPAASTVMLTRRIGSSTFANVPTIVFPFPAGPVVLSSGATCAGGTNAGTPCDRAHGATDVCTGGGAGPEYRGSV